MVYGIYTYELFQKRSNINVYSVISLTEECMDMY